MTLTFNTAMGTSTYTQAGGNGTITWSATGLPTGRLDKQRQRRGHWHAICHRQYSVRSLRRTDAGACPGTKNVTVTVAPVAGADAYTGLVDNTQFVVTGGTTVNRGPRPFRPTEQWVSDC